MKMMMAMLVIAAIALAGCVCDPYQGSKVDLEKIAATAAEKNGYTLSEYRLNQIKGGKIEGRKGWWVFFDGKVPTPGNHFAVWIDEQTLGAQVFPGE